MQALIAKDPSLARSHHDYRKPLYFAVRENRIEIVRFLLDHDSTRWISGSMTIPSRSRGIAATWRWNSC